MPEIKSGEIPGMSVAITQMHISYYRDLVGFGEVFETMVVNSMTEFLTRLDDPRNQIWTVIEGTDIMGSIAIDGQDLGNNLAHLRWFIINGELQGGGWGRKLLQLATNHCDQQNFAETHLWTFKGLDAARKLYEQNGFVIAEEKVGDQWGKTVTEQKFIRTRDKPASWHRAT